MRNYEAIIIFDPKLSDEQVGVESGKITKIIKDNGGSSDVVIDNWGKRELPYLMKKCSLGNYVVFYFESEAYDVVEKLQEQLRITESVLKFQTHRIQERIRKFRGRSQQEEGEAQQGEAAA